MPTRSASQIRILVAVCALMVLACASLVIAASNMGFKVVKPIVFLGSLPIGSNWTSLPYKNPYGTAGAFCRKVGLTTGIIGRASIIVLNETTGNVTTVYCGTSTADHFTLIPGKGIEIRQPSTTGAPSSIIIMGSHDNALSITIPDAGAGSVGKFWFSVPYHTTSTTVADLCQDAGLTSTGVPKARIVRLNASTGVATTVDCGTSAASAVVLPFGEFVQISEPNGPKTFTPSHY